MHIYTQTLPAKTAELIEQLRSSSFLQKFYLSGGTALALQIGHRESEDLDFFNKDNFDPLLLQQQLTSFGNLENVEVAEGTLNLFLQGVKLQFLCYPYDLLEPFVIWNSINLSSELDIACTKLLTISMRGSKKDFIDLYFLLQTYSLNQLLGYLPKKYKNTNYNDTHILKSLVYFDDADGQPMPRMHKEVNWETVKLEMVEQVKALKL